MIRQYIARLFPKWIWLQYGRQAKRRGFRQLYLILSFDCDTPRDAEVVEELQGWLGNHGIKTNYCVPGKQLEEAAEIYRRIAKKGAEFINHGALPHTEWRDNRYWSTTFYHEMQPNEIIEDIYRGDEIVRGVIGRRAIGFRAPHFGFFQEPSHLNLLHSTLKDLGYRYSTSTMPIYGLLRGPIWEQGGLYEIPVSGAFRSFFNVLDSWSHILSPRAPFVQDQYGELFIETAENLLALRVAGVLNYYVDPFHVYGSKAFFEAIEYVVKKKIPTLHYGELVDLANSKRL